MGKKINQGCNLGLSRKDCEFECARCSEHNAVTYYCDDCGEEVEVLYYVDGDEICEERLKKRFKIID